MATDITLNRSNARSLAAGGGERRQSPPRVGPADPPRSPASDPESDVAAAAVGSGILLIQACAVIPGLLPCLLLLLPLVLPPLVLGAAAGLLIELPLGIWRLLALAGRRWNRRPSQGEERSRHGGRYPIVTGGMSRWSPGKVSE
jgi:hypothetical protein